MTYSGRVPSVEAAKALADRGEVYGDIKENFQRIADLWSSLRGGDYTPADVAQYMRLVKESRLVESPSHHDSMVDICGYTDIQAQLVEKEETVGGIGKSPNEWWRNDREMSADEVNSLLHQKAAAATEIEGIKNDCECPICLWEKWCVSESVVGPDIKKDTLEVAKMQRAKEEAEKPSKDSKSQWVLSKNGMGGLFLRPKKEAREVEIEGKTPVPQPRGGVDGRSTAERDFTALTLARKSIQREYEKLKSEAAILGIEL